jgi:MoxR-like ATPase
MSVTPVSAPVLSPMPLADAVQAIGRFKAELHGLFLERDAEITGIILAAVSGQHLLLLGPPGTAKSELTLAVAHGLGWRPFVRLLGHNTVPDELFGPPDLGALKLGRYERAIDGYLPTAQVGFLDEVFKSSSVILNGLLTIMNERTYDHGSGRIGCPLEFLVGASNELPQDDGLGAVYDRFLLRYWVDYLRSDDTFEALLRLQRSGPVPSLDPRAIAAVRTAASTLSVDAVIKPIMEVRAALAGEKIIASDRRWRQSIGLMRASAAIAGRSAVTTRDLSVLVNCLWDRPQDRDAIRALISKHRSPQLSQAEELLASLREKMKGAPKPATTGGNITPAQLPAVHRLINELAKIIADAELLEHHAATDDEVAAICKTVETEAIAARMALARQSGGGLKA